MPGFEKESCDRQAYLEILSTGETDKHTRRRNGLSFLREKKLHSLASVRLPEEMPAFYLHKLFRVFLLLLLAGRSFTAVGQSPGDSARIDSLISSIPLLMQSDEEQAKLHISQLQQIAQKAQHRHGIIKTLFFQAWLGYRHGVVDAVINRIDSALQHTAGIMEDSSLAEFYILKGQCYVKKTQFRQALANFSVARELAKQRHDVAMETNTLVSIGWAYMEDAKPEAAIRFFKEVLALNPAPDYSNLALLLCNIASCYNSMGNYKLATEYATKGINEARRLGRMTDLANGLNILARSNYEQGNLDLALAYLKEGSRVREKVADPAMQASDYLEIAQLYLKSKQPEDAIFWAKKAEALSTEYANPLKMVAAYDMLARAYEMVNDYPNAGRYYKRMLRLKDSVADDRYTQAMAEMQVQFETQKKTSENLILKQENLEAKLANETKQRWLVISLFALGLLLVAAFFNYKSVKDKYRARLALQQLEEQKQRSQEVMIAEENERRRIAGALHDGICQTLAAASLQLKKASAGEERLLKVDELILQASNEVRELSHQVTPELLLNFGLIKAIERTVQQWGETLDEPKISFMLQKEAELDNDMLSLVLYRSFQELLNNVIKHAAAKNLVIQLGIYEEEIELLMEDDGKGFLLSENKEGLGLKNLQSRVHWLDGNFQMDSRPGRGSTAIISFKNWRQLRTKKQTL